jgi:hypothetical protein
LTTRTVRRRRLRQIYTRRLRSARVDLRLPPVTLPPADDLPAPLAEAASRLRREADDICQHRIDLLGSGLVDIGPEIDWHRDFKSGYRWPDVFYQEVEPTRLGDASDAKVPWELSRGHQLLTLGRAARLFEDEAYAKELEAQLSSWLSTNPPGVGINWVNPMEVGIRATNIIWALAALEQWRALREPTRSELVESLRWHGHHIAANLEGTPVLRSNHFLGDILGLLVLGATLTGEPEARRWFRFAHRAFEREMQKQVHADGVSFEASLSYHGLALEIFTVAAFVGAWVADHFSKAFAERLQKMTNVSRAVRHENGRIPLFGDQDSSRILPFGFDRAPTHDNLLWLAAAVVGLPRPLAGPPHPEVALSFGIDAWTGLAGRPVAPPPVSSAFRHGGLYALRSPRAHLVVRCGEVGQNGSGGHSHNDVLSFELSVGGLPLVVDSGTYAYTFDVAARNEFRSTRAHNTVVVDGRDIHPIDPARVFELRSFAKPKPLEWAAADTRIRFVGSHDGYRRLEEPVVHLRRLSLDTASGRLTVEDELGGAGLHTIESLLHIAPGAVLQRLTESEFEVQLEHRRVRVSFFGSEGAEISIEDGWVSDRYGVRERAPVLLASMIRHCPTSFGYVIAPASLTSSAAARR